MVDSLDSLKLCHRTRVQELMRGYRLSQVLIACAELGVFGSIGAGARTADELAVKLGAHVPSLVRLLNAATALGLLVKEGDSYRNSEMAQACLAEKGDYYLGGLVKREGAFYRRWSHLADAVRTGKRPEENQRDERNDNWVRDFEYALYDASRLPAPLIAAALAPYLPNHGDRLARVIDIGGGHGGYSIALAQRFPHLEAVVAELPAVVPVAQEIIAAAGVAERVSARACDFRTDELGEGYDVALLFGVLVSETEQGSIALLRKVHAALAPGGAVVIRGFYLQPDHAGPLEPALADLHMLLSTESGGTRTMDELQGWLNSAGFGDSRELIVSSDADIRLQVAVTCS